MTTPHTPGPWRQTGINVRAGDALICYAMNHHADAETPEPEKLANASLMAAAPELKAALEEILQWWIGPNDGDDMPLELWDNAQIALKRARGVRE